jgi:DNA-directed RNA polymerase specialized sigma24 family protein
MDKEGFSPKTRKAPLDAIFESLPPLDSPEYLALLTTSAATELPAQVLARVYRQLRRASADEVAQVTLSRLVANDDKYGYLRSIRLLAARRVARNQYWYEAEDLVQAAIAEVVKTLATQRGSLAETAWVLFCRHCFEDGWRVLNGRRGEKLRGERVEASPDEESEDVFDPVEETDGATAPWHVSAEESQLPWLEEFIRRTVSEFIDPLIRQVAEDQFGDDPSPLSSGRSRGGKLPLTEQLGADRFRIYRALRVARARLGAALLVQKERTIDIEWLRQLLHRDNKQPRRRLP